MLRRHDMKLLSHNFYRGAESALAREKVKAYIFEQKVKIRLTSHKIDESSSSFNLRI